MAVEVGRRYYFLVHAYYHYVGEVTEILGVRRVACKDMVQVHSSARSWTDFFRDGFGEDTDYDYVGASPDMSYFMALGWDHPIPEARSHRRRR